MSRGKSSSYWPSGPDQELSCPDIPVTPIQQLFDVGLIATQPFVDATDGTIVLDQSRDGDRRTPQLGRSKDLSDGSSLMFLTGLSIGGDWSVAFWVRSSSTFGALTLNAGGAEISFAGGDVTVSDGAGASFAAGVAVNDGNWHHVAVTWNGTTGDTTTYVDGYERASAAIAGLSITDPVFGGGIGELHDVHFRSETIDKAEVIRIYRSASDTHHSANAGSGKTAPASLVAWLPMEDAGNPLSASDATGNHDGAFQPTDWATLTAINSGSQTRFSIANVFAVEIEN